MLALIFLIICLILTIPYTRIKELKLYFSLQNPDPILNMRMVPVQERKYHIILEFEEPPIPPKPQMSTSGMIVITPEEITRDSREQLSFFSWIKETHAMPMGMLLVNVERISKDKELKLLYLE